MIWLTEQAHEEVLADPNVKSAGEASMRLSAWALERGTPAAIHAAARAQEASYWIIQDLVHAIAEREDARAAAASAASNGNGDPPSHGGSM